jgi:hypothetical protein
LGQLGYIQDNISPRQQSGGIIAKICYLLHELT